MEDSNGKMAGIVAAVIISLIVGGGAGYALGMNKDSNTEDAAMTATASPTAMSQESDGVTVGGAKMVKTLDIVDNAVNASNVTTVVSLVKLADLVDTLKGAGPFTVFAPDNGAFAKLPAATVSSLQLPENKATLAKILTYHVVSGTYTSADLRVMAAKGQTLTSVEGQVLTPMVDGNSIKIMDVSGGSSMVVTSDVVSSNGVTHVVDSVLMPK